ncbi:hypothetical protein ACROYT_G018586 [Oculina patagonica]
MNNSTAPTPDNFNQEPPCSQTVSTLFIVALSIITLAAFIGNILVIVSFLKTPSLRTSTNYYMVNMAISDLFCACFNWPLYATEGMLTSRVFITEPMATVVCKLGMYFRGISQVVSVLSLVLIAVDRYVAIVFPMKMTMLRRKRARLALALLTWIIPITSGFPFFHYTEIVKEGDQTFCRTTWSKSMNTIYNGVGFVIFYCAPFITMVILYTRTICEFDRFSHLLPLADRLRPTLKTPRLKLPVFFSLVRLHGETKETRRWSRSGISNFLALTEIP